MQTFVRVPPAVVLRVRLLADGEHTGGRAGGLLGFSGWQPGSGAGAEGDGAGGRFRPGSGEAAGGGKAAVVGGGGGGPGVGGGELGVVVVFDWVPRVVLEEVVFGVV